MPTYIGNTAWTTKMPLDRAPKYLYRLLVKFFLDGGILQVAFVGSFDDAQKSALLTGCIALIYTPSNEHFGIVPLEAMSHRLSVIACNSGGPRETVLNGQTGFLCESAPRSFAVAMQKVLVSL